MPGLDDLEPDLDELVELEDDEDALDLALLLDGIEEEDDYEPEPWESLDALAEEEGEEFDPWAASGVKWDDYDD